MCIDFCTEEAGCQLVACFLVINTLGYSRSAGDILSPKYIMSWSRVCPQFQLVPVHFLVISTIARYMLLNRASSVGKTAFAFVTLRNPRLKFSMELVVYMIFRISAGYLKNVENLGQLLRPKYMFSLFGYFL